MDQLTQSRNISNPLVTDVFIKQLHMEMYRAEESWHPAKNKMNTSKNFSWIPENCHTSFFQSGMQLNQAIRNESVRHLIDISNKPGLRGGMSQNFKNATDSLKFGTQYEEEEEEEGQESDGDEGNEKQTKKELESDEIQSLHHAVQSNDYHLFEKILKRDFALNKINHPDARGRTAFDYARSDKIKKLLAQRGAQYSLWTDFQKPKKKVIGKIKDGITIQGFCENAPERCSSSKDQLPILVNLDYRGESPLELNLESHYRCGTCGKELVMGESIKSVHLHNGFYTVTRKDKASSKEEILKSDRYYTCELPVNIDENNNIVVKIERVKQQAKDGKELINLVRDAINSKECENLFKNINLKQDRFKEIISPNLQPENEELNKTLKLDNGGDVKKRFSVGRFIILCDNENDMKEIVDTIKQSVEGIIVSEVKDYFKKKSKSRRKLHNIRLYVSQHKVYIEIQVTLSRYRDSIENIKFYDDFFRKFREWKRENDNYTAVKKYGDKVLQEINSIIYEWEGEAKIKSYATNYQSIAGTKLALPPTTDQAIILNWCKFIQEELPREPKTDKEKALAYRVRLFYRPLINEISKDNNTGFTKKTRDPTNISLNKTPPEETRNLLFGPSWKIPMKTDKPKFTSSQTEWLEQNKYKTLRDSYRSHCYWMTEPIKMTPQGYVCRGNKIDISKNQALKALLIHRDGWNAVPSTIQSRFDALKPECFIKVSMRFLVINYYSVKKERVSGCLVREMLILKNLKKLEFERIANYVAHWESDPTQDLGEYYLATEYCYCAWLQNNQIYEPMNLDSYTKQILYSEMSSTKMFADAIQQGKIPRDQFCSSSQIRQYDSLSVIQRIFQQIVEVIVFLREQKVAHLDICLENLLIAGGEKKRPKIKLVDFSVAQNCNGPNQSLYDQRVGRDAYMAPEVKEVIPKKGYDAYAADVWSVGVCLWFMLLRQYPFEHKPIEAKDLAQLDLHKLMIDMNLLPMVTEDAFNVFKQIFQPSNTRITAENLQKMPYCRQPGMEEKDQKENS